MQYQEQDKKKTMTCSGVELLLARQARAERVLYE